MFIFDLLVEDLVIRCVGLSPKRMNEKKKSCESLFTGGRSLYLWGKNWLFIAFKLIFGLLVEDSAIVLVAVLLIFVLLVLHLVVRCCVGSVDGSLCYKSISDLYN